MGDDLTAARRFCGHATANMELLMAAIVNNSVCAPHILIEYLAGVQSQAKSQHALAIYRGAQNVIDAVNASAPLERVQGRALSLNKLIVQYQAGLDEIAPAPANVPEMNAAEINEGSLLLPSAPPPFPSAEDAALAAKYERARAALLPLMGFANQAGEAAALGRLAGFTQSELTPAGQHDIGGENNAEAASQTEAALGAAASAMPVKKSLASSLALTSESKKQDKPRAPDVDFETLMPHFTSQALQAARQVQKTVSVSYAAEDVRLSFEQAQALQPVLQHIAQQIVMGVLERPETRAQRGDSSAGHIALTASQQSGMVSISLDCPGAPMLVSAFTPKVHSVKGLAITPGEHTAQGLMHIVMSLPASENKLARPKGEAGARQDGEESINQTIDKDGAASGVIAETHNRPASELAL